MEVIASAPGKVFLLGEYAVTLGAPAIVAASERRLVCRARARAGRGELTVTADGSRHRGRLDAEALDGVPAGCRFVVAAALRSSAALGLHGCDVEIETRSELAPPAAGAVKPGLGGSAAAVAATVAATFALAGRDVDASTTRRRIGLGIEAHRLAQGGGSGADVVAATVGGLSCIRGLDASVPGEASPEAVLARLAVASVSLPAGLAIEVVASGGAAATGPRAARFLRRARDARTARLLAAWTEGMEAAVTTFLDACERGDADGAVRAVALARDLLGRLGALAGFPVWTAGLRRACDALGERPGVAIKPSGAGGGDCAVALVPARLRTELLAAWRDRGLEPIGSAGGAPGVRVSTETEAAHV